MYLGGEKRNCPSGSSSEAELPMGAGHSTALQKNPLLISSFAGRKAPFSLQSREQKGGDERGREREHFRLVIQLQRSESICRASEVCLFLQEQRKKTNGGVMGLGLTILASSWERRMSHKDSVRCCFKSNPVPIASCIQVR